MDTRKPGPDIPAAHSPRQTSILGSAFATVRSFFTPERNARKVLNQSPEPAPTYDPNLSALGRDLASLNLNDSAVESDTSFQTVDSFKSANSSALEEMLNHSTNDTAVLDGTLMGSSSLNSSSITSQIATMSPITRNSVPVITITSDNDIGQSGEDRADDQPVTQDYNAQAIVYSPFNSNFVSEGKIIEFSLEESPDILPAGDDVAKATINRSANVFNSSVTVSEIIPVPDETILSFEPVKINKNEELMPETSKLLDVTAEAPVTALSPSYTPMSVDCLLNTTVNLDSLEVGKLVSNTPAKLLDISVAAPELPVSPNNSDKPVSIDSILNSTVNYGSLPSPLPCPVYTSSIDSPPFISPEGIASSENDLLNISQENGDAEVQARFAESRGICDSATDSDIEEIEESPLQPEILDSTWTGNVSLDGDLDSDELFDEIILDTEDREALQEVSDDEGDISVDLPPVLDDEEFCDVAEEMFEDVDDSLQLVEDEDGGLAIEGGSSVSELEEKEQNVTYCKNVEGLETGEALDITQVSGEIRDPDSNTDPSVAAENNIRDFSVSKTFEEPANKTVDEDIDDAWLLHELGDEENKDSDAFLQATTVNANYDISEKEGEENECRSATSFARVPLDKPLVNSKTGEADNSAIDSVKTAETDNCNLMALLSKFEDQADNESLIAEFQKVVEMLDAQESNQVFGQLVNNSSAETFSGQICGTGDFTETVTTGDDVQALSGGVKETVSALANGSDVPKADAIISTCEEASPKAAMSVTSGHADEGHIDVQNSSASDKTTLIDAGVVESATSNSSSSCDNGSRHQMAQAATETTAQTTSNHVTQSTSVTISAPANENFIATDRPISDTEHTNSDIVKSIEIETIEAEDATQLGVAPDGDLKASPPTAASEIITDVDNGMITIAVSDSEAASQLKAIPDIEAIASSTTGPAETATGIDGSMAAALSTIARADSLEVPANTESQEAIKGEDAKLEALGHESCLKSAPIEIDVAVDMQEQDTENITTVEKFTEVNVTATAAYVENSIEEAAARCLSEMFSSVEANVAEENLAALLKEIEELEPQNIPDDAYARYSDTFAADTNPLNSSSSAPKELKPVTHGVGVVEEIVVKETINQENNEVKGVESSFDMTLLTEVLRKASLNETGVLESRGREMGKRDALKERLLEDLTRMEDSPLHIFDETRSIASYASPCSSASGDVLFASTPVESPLNAASAVPADVMPAADGVHKKSTLSQTQALDKDGKEISPVMEIVTAPVPSPESHQDMTVSIPLMNNAFMKSSSIPSSCYLNETVTVTSAKTIESQTPQEVIQSDMVNSIQATIASSRALSVTAVFDNEDAAPLAIDSTTALTKPECQALQDDMDIANGNVLFDALLKSGATGEALNETVVLDHNEMAPATLDMKTALGGGNMATQGDTVLQFQESGTHPLNETVALGNVATDVLERKENSTKQDDASSVQAKLNSAPLNETVTMNCNEVPALALNTTTVEEESVAPEGDVVLPSQVSDIALAKPSSCPLNETVILDQAFTATLNTTIIVKESKDYVAQEDSALSLQAKSSICPLNETVVLEPKEVPALPLNTTTGISEEDSLVHQGGVVLLSQVSDNALAKSSSCPLNETVILDQKFPATSNTTTVSESKENVAQQYFALSEQINICPLNETVVLDSNVPDLAVNTTTVINEKESVALQGDTIFSEKGSSCTLNETIILNPPLEGISSRTEPIQNLQADLYTKRHLDEMPIPIGSELNTTQIVARSEEIMPAVASEAVALRDLPQPSVTETLSCREAESSIPAQEKIKKSVAFILPDVHNIKPSPLRCPAPSDSMESTRAEALMRSALQCAQAVAALAADTSSTQEYIDRSLKEQSFSLHEDTFNAEQAQLSKLSFLETLQENKQTSNVWNLTTASPQNKNMLSKRSNVLKEINDNIPENSLKNMGGWFSGSPKPDESTTQKSNELGSLFSSEDFNLFNTAFQPPAGVVPRESLYVKFDPLFAPKAMDSTIFVQAIQGASEPHTVKGNLIDLCQTKKVMSQVELKAEIARLSELYVERERATVEIEAANKQKEMEEVAACDELRKNIADSEDRLKNISEKHRAIEQNNNKLEVVAFEYKRIIEEVTDTLTKNRLGANKMITDLVQEKNGIQKHLASAEAAFIDVFAKYEKFRCNVVEYRDKQSAEEKEIGELRREIGRYDERIRAAEMAAAEEVAELERAAAAEVEHHVSEVTRLKMQLRKEELKLTHIEDSLSMKVVENKKLAEICDDLIAGRS